MDALCASQVLPSKPLNRAAYPGLLSLALSLGLSIYIYLSIYTCTQIPNPTYISARPYRNLRCARFSVPERRAAQCPEPRASRCSWPSRAAAMLGPRFNVRASGIPHNSQRRGFYVRRLRNSRGFACGRNVGETWPSNPFSKRWEYTIGLRCYKA